MDINDRGPVLGVGRFKLRVTNIGVLGNAFLDRGLSFDPSFEYPKGSGQELLNHAELWVGARREDGQIRVSGGPILEWRPTLAPADTVRIARAGDPGSLPHVDDDADGRVDEDPLNGRDDDGDGRVDEDFLLPAQEMLTSEFTDTQPQSIDYAYPNGESHSPLGLAVHQEVYGWALPGHNQIAAVVFTITNQSRSTLHDVRLGLYADLDARGPRDGSGHLDDLLVPIHYSFALPMRLDTLEVYWVKQCVERIAGDAVQLRDASLNSTVPSILLVPLSHTTDPLGFLVKDVFPGVADARARARAPRRDSTFRIYAFAPGSPPGQGGPPVTDGDRYRALAGEYPQTPVASRGDYAALVACGPFASLAAGQSVRFSLALIAVGADDAPEDLAFAAKMLARGDRRDLTTNGRRGAYSQGRSGINGHEICLEPPPGVAFVYDPHCPEKFRDDPELKNTGPLYPPTVAIEVPYQSGSCVWTDLDCDLCTGDDGVDEIRPWELDMRLPTSPRIRLTPGDRTVRIEWDNRPELDIASLRVGGPQFAFAGYKLYRLDDWRRAALLPRPEQWQRLAVFRSDPAIGGQALANITMGDVAPDSIGSAGPVYPIGRYAVVDSAVLNGFDYQYVVTTILRGYPNGATQLPAVEYESPFATSFDTRTVPHAAAAATGRKAWVVPNPYRGSAEWERQAVGGDPFTRHIDFMGLPRARCRIRIFTLAGDLVQQIDHDGSRGDGQAAWNLISRNGQDVASGVYLFAIDSDLGRQIGRFVILR